MNTLQQHQDIAAGFVEAASLAGLTIPLNQVEVQFHPAPHKQPSSLPQGKSAVYVFVFGDRCLKVGKAGPKSTARFVSQHYGLKAPSTLAKSLLEGQDAIGVTGLIDTNVKAWICGNTTRINYMLPSEHGVFALSLLESFVQCRLNPVFEGFAGQRMQPNQPLHPDALTRAGERRR